MNDRRVCQGFVIKAPSGHPTIEVNGQAGRLLHRAGRSFQQAQLILRVADRGRHVERIHRDGGQRGRPRARARSRQPALEGVRLAVALGEEVLRPEAENLVQGGRHRRVIVNRGVDGRIDERRDQDAGNPHAEAFEVELWIAAIPVVGIDGGRRRDVIVEAAVLVVQHDQQALLPIPAAHQRIVDTAQEVLTQPDVVRRMLVGRRPVVGPHVVRLDEAVARERALLQIREEPREVAEIAIGVGLDDGAELLDQPVPQARDAPGLREVARVDPPRDVVGVELVVNRRRARIERFVEPAAHQAARRGGVHIETIRPRRPRQRREPAGARAVFAGQRGDHRHRLRRMAFEDESPVARQSVCGDLPRVVPDEPVHRRFRPGTDGTGRVRRQLDAVDLLVGALEAVMRIDHRGEIGPGRDRDFFGPRIGRIQWVAEAAGKLAAAWRVSEQVIERTILEHDDDDVRGGVHDSRFSS